MTKTVTEANKLYEQIWNESSDRKQEKLTKTINLHRAKLDGWEYTFFF